MSHIHVERDNDCVITVRRSGLRHVCFVDLDSLPDFFHDLNENLDSILREEKVFLFVYLCHRAPHAVLNSNSFYWLLRSQRVEMEMIPKPSGQDRPVLCVDALEEKVKQLHGTLDDSVFFTIVAGELYRRRLEMLSSVVAVRRNISTITPQQAYYHHRWTHDLKQRLRICGSLQPSSSGTAGVASETQVVRSSLNSADEARKHMKIGVQPQCDQSVKGTSCSDASTRAACDSLILDQESQSKDSVVDKARTKGFRLPQSSTREETQSSVTCEAVKESTSTNVENVYKTKSPLSTSISQTAFQPGIPFITHSLELHSPPMSVGQWIPNPTVVPPNMINASIVTPQGLNLAPPPPMGYHLYGENIYDPRNYSEVQYATYHGELNESINFDAKRRPQMPYGSQGYFQR